MPALSLDNSLVGDTTTPSPIPTLFKILIVAEFSYIQSFIVFQGFGVRQTWVKIPLPLI